MKFYPTDMMPLDRLAMVHKKIENIDEWGNCEWRGMSTTSGQGRITGKKIKETG